MKFRLTVGSFDGNGRKGCQRIQSAQQCGGSLQLGTMLGNGPTQFREQGLLAFDKQPFGVDESLLDLLQPCRRISLCIRKGLPADEVLRHAVLVCVGHFDVIAEHTGLTDLQRGDASGLPLLVLIFGDPLLAVSVRIAISIKLCVISRPEHGSHSQLHRRLINEGRLKRPNNIGMVDKSLGQILQRCRGRTGTCLLHHGYP